MMNNNINEMNNNMNNINQPNNNNNQPNNQENNNNENKNEDKDKEKEKEKEEMIKALNQEKNNLLMNMHNLMNNMEQLNNSMNTLNNIKLMYNNDLNNKYKEEKSLFNDNYDDNYTFEQDKEIMDDFLFEKKFEGKDELDNKKKEKLKSNEKYKGTFINVIHCLSSNTLQNMVETFCYDEINSCFYLLSVSILSISIFVCDTFEKQFENEFNILEKELNIKLKDILKNKAEFILDNFGDKINIFLKCFKMDLPWKYSNNNFFYSSLALNNLNKDEKTKYAIGEYPHRLFHSKRNNDFGFAEVFNDKIKSTVEKNQKFIFDKIKQISDNKLELIESVDNNKFDSPSLSENYKKEKYYENKLPTVSNSAFNWTCKNFISYKVKYMTNNPEEEKEILNIINSKNELCLYNTRFFYGQNNSDEFTKNYKLILEEKNGNKILFLLKLKYLLRDCQYYYTFENKEIKNILEELNTLINEILLENKNNKEILDMIFNIIEENFELIFDTEIKREKLYMTLNKINQDSFYINLTSFENIISLKLKNSFYRINNYKSLYLTRDLLSKTHLLENVGNKKYISSLGSSPNNSLDMGSNYDENYSDEDKFYKEMINEKNSVNSVDENKTEKEVKEIKDIKENKKIMIQGNFSEINKKKYFGFNFFENSEYGVRMDAQKIYTVIKNEILEINNKKYFYYFIECCLHSLFLPNINIKTTKLIINNIYLLIKELFNKENNDENILNLCHIYFLASNFLKNKLNLNELNKFINNYIEIFELLCNKLNKKIPEFISNTELLGPTPENKKVFEYSLNTNDLNFLHEINFASNDLIAVEIELINRNPEDLYPSNRDILLYTNYNSKLTQSKRNTTKNNYKDFGTCFLHKISGDPIVEKKIYILFGNILCLSTVASSLGSSGGVPSLIDLKFVASQIPEFKGKEFSIVTKVTNEKNEVINQKLKIPLKPVDTKLRITCYPFKGGNFYGKGRFAIDNANIEKQLNCLDEVNYVINNFYKMLINVENKNKNSDIEKYKNIPKLKKDNKALLYYKNIIEKKNLDDLILINQNKKYYIYDNETNPVLNILKYIQNKDHYKIIELNDEVKNINIPNLRGLDKLSQFNSSLWNIIKNGLYLYTNKDIEFISQFLNQLAMNIKRKKGTYDMIKNLTYDILDMLDKQDKQDEKDKNVDLKKNIEEHIINEVKSMYFNNEAALDEICQVNNIQYEKLGNDIKLKNLNSFFLSELNLLTKYSKYTDYDSEQRKEIENKLILEKSPFIHPLVNIIQKIVILNLFEIEYISEEKNLLKEFLFDQDLNLDNLVNDILSKYKNIAIKLYGFDLYYNYIVQIKENKDFIYKFLLNDYSLINVNFFWDLDIDIIKNIISKEKINEIIDTKMQLLYKVLTKDLNKKNITYQIGKIILIINDIIKLFPVLDNIMKNDVSKKSIEMLKIIFNDHKKLFGENNFKEFIELFNKLLINLTKDIPSIISEIIEIFIKEINILFQNTDTKILNRDEEIEKKKNISLILSYIIKFLQNINLKSNEKNANESILKLLDVIFSVITSSNKKEILNSLISIVKTIMSNINQKDFRPDFSKIYTKLGHLYFLAEKSSLNNNNNSAQKISNKKYKLIFNAANSELDYGILVNALYYFEEKYPTVLSRYRLDKKFEKNLEKMTLEEIKKFNIIEMESSSVYNPANLLVTLDPKMQKLEEDKFAKKGTLKEIVPFTSVHNLLKNATSHTVNPGIARLRNKKLKTWKMTDKVNKYLVELYNKLNEQIIKNQKEKKNNTKKILEIKLDIMHIKRIQQHIKVAEKLGDLACLRGHSVLSNKYTYEQVLYFSNLIHQCLNFKIMSPPIGLNNTKPLFVYEDIFLALPKPEELIDGYTNVIKETSVNYANVTIIKESLYEKLIDIKKESINIINNTKKEYILDEQIMSTISQLTQIIYYYLNIDENFYKKIIEELSEEMNKELDKINLEKILGVLYLISGEYNLLKTGQKVLYNGKKAIISDIFLNKYNQCEIQLIKENEENKNFEVVSQKMKVNYSEIITQNTYTKKLIHELNLNDLIKYLLKINESKNKSDLLLNIILKILYQSNKEKLYSINEELRQKLIDTITPYSCFIQSPTISELEFSYTQSLFSKFEKNYKRLYQDIFIPRYNTYIPPNSSPEGAIKKIQNQVLPESDFISCLPQVSLNKGLSCLQNAIIFDKIFVELIINAYRHDKYKNAVAMSTSQIRSHLLNGNLKSAYDDLSIVFENAPVSNIFDDNYNPNRVSMEKCITGKMFLCHDKKLQKEKLVIILLCDFTNRLCLVMTPGSEVKIFWTSYENLDMINTNYSPLCYLTNELDKKFKINLDRLNAAYANKILVRLNQCGNMDENKDMSMVKLIDWNENCKDNIIYSEIDNNSGTNIGNLLTNANNNGLINDNENLLKNVELQKIILNQWKQLHDDIKIYNINLFQNIKLNSGSLLPLRKLCMKLDDKDDDNISTNNKYNKIIISFDSNAFLGPQATLRFYSDEEGKNLLYEIQSIKKEKYGLQSILINNSEVYVEYIPGTTVFYLGEWYLHSRDSDLPCIVAFIPNNFDCLMNMTNNLTNIVMNNQNMLKELITCITSNCINDNFPILLQMNLFKLLNNIFNNLSMYFNNDSNKYKEIFEKCDTIEQKLNAIGLNKNIFDKFNQIFTEKMDSHNKDIFFASPYIIELSNCILNVISLINEPIENTKTILIEEFKLFNLLKKIKENKPIDNKIHTDIVNKLKNYASQQLKKILLIENKKSINREGVISHLEEYGGVIQDYDSDIISLDGGKIFGIIIDQFNIGKLTRLIKPEKKEEEKKEESPEDQMWECAACHQLNDKDNESCVFCDGPKVIAPPKKEIKKKVVKNEEENKNDINNYKIDECLDIIKQKIANDFNIIKEDNVNYNKLMNILLTTHFKNMKNFSEKKSEIEFYYKNIKKDEEKLSQINSVLNIIKDGKEISLSDVNKLFEYDIDIYLDIYTSNDDKISIDKINDLGKIIFSLQKLPNLISIYDLIQTPSIFRSKEILVKNNTLYTMTIGELRYYLNIISLINDSFTLSMSLLRPPELKKLSKQKEDQKDEYSSLSTLMTQFRYIISPKIKNEILQNIIALTEYDEDLIQIPSFNVERLSDDKNGNNKNNNGDQIFKKFIIKPLRKPGGEFIFQKINTAPDIIFKNMTEFNQVYEQYLQVDPACFRVKRFDLVHVAFKIKYMNEFVQGLSGPYRQFFSDIANELENSDKINLLCPTQNNINKKGEYKDKYTINPKSEEFSQFEFLGILMGLCIRTGVYLPVNLCSLVWKKIIGEKIEKNDILIFDEGLNKMGDLLFKKDNEINQELLTSSFGENISSISLTDNSEKKLSKTYTTKDLITSKKDRIDLFKEIHTLRLNESNSQISSIIKGINKIIPMSVLQYFTWEEMERLVCGKKTVDIELLERNTVIAPELEKKNYLVKWVWEIVKEFSEEERIQFVKFCYAQERLPYTQEEYDQKQIQFSIKFNANFHKNGLPRADTCFFFLILPDYTSKEIMKKMISIAIKMDNVGMNGDKENNENRRQDKRISSFGRFDRFDDDNYFDE